MKLVREHIFEKFNDDSDPITDMDIGINHVMNFDSNLEAVNWLANNVAAILKLPEIPDDIINTEWQYINKKYSTTIIRYVYDYLRVNQDHIFGRMDAPEIDRKNHVTWIEKLHEILKNRGFKPYRGLSLQKNHQEFYKRKIQEKFTNDSDPIEDMGIGLYSKRNIEISKLVDFIIDNLNGILETNKIPDDIIYYDHPQFVMPWSYYKTIDTYMKKYITITINGQNWPVTMENILGDFRSKLCQMGYPKK